MTRPHHARRYGAPATQPAGATRRSTSRSPSARCSISTTAGSTPRAYTRCPRRRIAPAASGPRCTGMSAASAALEAGRFEESRAGWRVVTAAFFGVMVSFGSLLVFTFGVFVKPSGRRIRLEPRVDLRRLRFRRHDGSAVFAGTRLPARPLRTAPHHPALHGGLRRRRGVSGIAHAEPAATVWDLRRAGRGRQWHHADGLFARRVHLVR